MAYKVMKNCRICGKLYTPCVDCENDNSAFHWRKIACSYECGKEYLRRVMEARNNKISDVSTTEKNSEVSSVNKMKRVSKKVTKAVKNDKDCD